MHTLADRNLLFGLLALQTGMIDQSALFVAFSTWTRDKARSLAEILVDQGAIDEGDRAALAGMAGRHLKRHGEDAEKSLAAVSLKTSTREALEALGDPELSVALPRAGATVDADDPYRTASSAAASSPPGGLRFRILRPHAKGGLGAVSVALDGELNREVALKEILERHADDPASQARFLVEAEITGGLEHPGIVPVYGLGRYADGRPYYAMRFIRGDSLEEAIAGFHGDDSLKSDPGKRSLALRALLRRFVDVCNAVDYAHGRGVLHRDLKPSNIIVGKHGETLVVDWGLAKAMGSSESGPRSDERTLVPSGSSGSGETLPGSAIGTPSYMSPEQSLGDLDRLGPRSDVYSLGATLYSLLTAKAPFEGGDLGGLLRAVQEGAFPKPRQVDPAIDRALEAVCLKAMATRPEDRYATARALADDLDRWAADEPVLARREPASARARRWMRRHRTAVTAASVALLVAVVGLGGVLAVSSRANAALEAKNAELAKAVAREAAASDGLREANARVQARFDLAREAIRAFQSGVNEDDMLKGPELKGLRDKLLRSAAGFYEKLEKLLQGQADRASRAILAQTYFELGELTEKIGSIPEALAVHRKALAIRRELATSPDADPGSKLDLARSVIAAGSLYENVADSPGALSAIEEARELAEALSVGPGATVEARKVLGDALQRIGWALSSTRRAEAMESYRRALAIQDRLARENPAVGEFRFKLADIHVFIGKLLAESGDMGQAREYCQKGLAIFRKLADDYPAVTDYRNHLAISYFAIGMLHAWGRRTSEAFEAFRESLAISTKLVEDHPAVSEYRNYVAVSHENLGLLQSRTGHPAEALESQRRALVIRNKLAEDNPTVPVYRLYLLGSLVSVGALQATMGHPADVLESHLKALAIRRQLADASPGDEALQQGLAENHVRLGAIRADLGDAAGGVAEYRQAVAILGRLSPTTTAAGLYDLACLRSMLAGIAARPGSGVAGEEAEAVALAAVATLKRATEAGFRNLAHMKQDADLDPIRRRPDFRALMDHLAFPVDPFAR